MSTRANEPAYPFPAVTTANGDVQWGAHGMSLREHFAGMAMQGLLSQGADNPSDLAAAAAEIADALVAELAKETK